MNLARLIADLSDPSAYPHPAAPVEVKQTHVSAVFLAGEYVYKIKKPVNFGFLDYSTLEQRKRFCEREVEINRTLAPSVYLGVEPIRREGGRIKVGGDGEVVEHAVKMLRLPDSAHLRARLERDEEIRPILDRLVSVLVRSYAASPATTGVEAVDRVVRFARENLDGGSDLTLSAAVRSRLRAATERAVAELGPILRLRAGSFVRDTHGDLRLDHVYQLDEIGAEPPVAIDRLEFNDDFSVTDVVADVAFLAMDLIAFGRRDLAEFLIGRYESLAADATCRTVFPFFVSYRSAVRAKVRTLAAEDPELSESARAESIARARGHWLLALDQLEAPGHRPGLVLVCGLPGTGKSSLAKRLAETAGFVVVRSDEIRKDLAGVGDRSATAAFGEGIYTPEWTARTYAECFRRAEAELFEGRRVVIDASFSQAKLRREALARANRLGVRSVFLECVLDRDATRNRLVNRRNDVSDADVAIHEKAAEAWEPTGAEATRVDGAADVDRVVLERLHEVGLI